MATTSHDAISILVSDHKHVKSLFDQFAKLGDRATTEKKKLANQLCHELTIHSQLEEELFYPAVRAHIDQDSLTDEALLEHAAAKKLIMQITFMDPGDELYDAKVHVLAKQIAQHVAEEEGAMFPAARKAKMDLLALGNQMVELREKLEGVTA